MIHHRLLIHRCIIFAFLLLTAHCSLLTASAQSATATLSGTVTDPNGAVVPGVEITLVNPATALERQATTNDDGYFRVPFLPPGSYSVTARREGFFVVQMPNIILNVGDEKSLQINLKVGDVNAQVQINADAPLIDESPAVGTVVDRQFVGNLPLNGRSFQTLISLTPGTVLTKSSFTEAGQFSVNGQRANANYFTVDGVSANSSITSGISSGQVVGGSVPALAATGGTNNLVSVDALQEFKILTSTYGPEFGRTPGAQVSIVTRSGTNEYHGAIFEYFRNEKLDANDWFANANRLAKPVLRQNDFGGVIGGPVILPRFGEGGRAFISGRNRTFFFLSYEGLRLRQPLVGITDVPSLTARATAVPAIQPFLKAYPLPTGPERSNGFAEFAASFSNPSTLNATSLRIDHTLNRRLTLFGRYNDAPSEVAQRGSNVNSLNTVLSTSLNTKTLTVGSTLIASSSVSNDFRINLTRYVGASVAELDGFGGAVVPADSILFPSFVTRQNSTLQFNLTGGRNSNLTTGVAGHNIQRQLNVVDSLLVGVGPHQMKMGVDYRRLNPAFNLLSYAQNVAISTINNAIAGRASSVSILALVSSPKPLLTNLSLYWQDTWRASPRMTLTYGIRYEVNPPATEQTGNEQFAVTGLDNPTTLNLAPRGTRIYQTTYDNFAPRFGIAYHLFQNPGRETVVRGGVGIFYDLGNGQATTAFGNGFPYQALKFVANVDFPLTPALAAPPIFDLNQRPIATTVYAFDPHLKLPLVYQWNVAVEQSLGANQTASASYLGAAGRRLLRGELLINPSPNFSRVNVTTNKATSDYHALQVQFQRRLSRGLQALASFTWSKSMDIASNDSTFSTPANRLDPKTDRGPSDFDMRHALTGAVTYDLPALKLGRVGNAILNQWSIDSIFSARSAVPVNIRYVRDIGFGLFLFRPDLIPGIPFYLNDPNAPGGRRFNNVVPSAAQIAAAGCAPSGALTPAKGPFCTPVTARQGTVGRNALRGFPIHQIDLTIRRQFNFSERLNLRLSADFFNIFNHPNFADQNGLLNSSGFGVSTSMLGRSLGSGGVNGGLNPLYQVGGPRSIQLAAKFQF